MRTIGIQIALACLMMTVLDSAGCQAGDYPTREDCDQDHDGFLANTPECMHGMDCDDSDPRIPAAQEVCYDGKDNDCNGQTDENCCTSDEMCDPIEWPGPNHTLTGICKRGAKKCQPNGSLSPDCLGATLPMMSESCDGLDNDCDGETDEDFIYYPLEGGTLKIGNICSLEKGACKYLSKVQCLDFFHAGCKTLPGAPTSGPNEPRFTQARDKNGNLTWDWNCNGVIDQKCCIEDPPGSMPNCDYDSDCHPNMARSTDDPSFCIENCNQHLSNCAGLMFNKQIYIVPKLPNDYCGEVMIKACICHMHLSSCEASFVGIVKGQIGCY